MKIVVFIVCALVAVGFLVFSTFISLHTHSSAASSKEHNHDSTEIVVPETIPVTELKKTDPSSLSSQKPTQENATALPVQAAVSAMPAASSSVPAKNTFSHENAVARKTPGYGILRRNIKPGFPDIEIDLSSEMTKDVARQYNFVLAVAEYRDSLLQIKAYITNPFGLHPVVNSDVSNVSTFSSRPRSDELPDDVRERIKNAAEKRGIWSSSSFFCWLVPNRVEKRIMSLQEEAIASAGYSLKDVARTIGCYDQDLRIHIEAIETRDGTAITIENKGGMQ